jgi:single-strand DNA-binding protein
VDGDPNFFVVNCWRTLAENVGSSVGRGDPVVVTGRLRLRTWHKDENSRIVNAEIDAISVGHDLRWGTTAFHRVRRQDNQPDRETTAPLDGHENSTTEVTTPTETKDDRAA